MGLRAPFQSFLYNPGGRVETLLVSMGVMGFLGDLRGRNSKSPPNPLGLAERGYSFHRCGRSPSLDEGGMGMGKSRVCGISTGARCAPLQRGGNRNGEMRLQRWAASLQRLDAFATDGCIAVPCRGAHCAPVRPRRYNNNPSRGRAKGYRGDRRHSASSRFSLPKDLPLRGRGTAAAVEGVRPP